MMTISIKLDDGSELKHGILAIFAVNDLEYAAAIPLKENDEPANADVALFGCEVDEEGFCNFFDIESEEEYEIASKAFQSVLAAT